MIELFSSGLILWLTHFSVQIYVACMYCIYGAECICRWLQEHNTSPKTNQVLEDKKLIPNVALRSMISEREEQEKMLDKRIQKRNKFRMDTLPQINMRSFSS